MNDETLRNHFNEVQKKLGFGTQQLFAEWIVKVGIRTKYNPQNISNMSRGKSPINLDFLVQVSLKAEMPIKINMLVEAKKTTVNIIKLY